MIRRRRPNREIAFSFDSFLDVVANVVGIILRLILVAWVGARSYKACVPPPPPPPILAEEDTPAPPSAPADPLAAELPGELTKLESAQAKLEEQKTHDAEIERQAAFVKSELAAVTARRAQLDAARAAQAKANGEKGDETRAAEATLAEMKERSAKLQKEVEAAGKGASAKQTFRYRTPVSKPLQTDEVLFECRAGRVTLVDISGLLDDAERRSRDLSAALDRQWEVQDETSPVGAFRLRFILERERSGVDALSSMPLSRRNYQYFISAWQVVPVDSQRGETAEQALAAGSAFRRVIDALDPSQTAVTFWIYSDSFATYRKVRDALHDRDVVVAGRPLPDGFPISAGKRGTVSRGQ